MKLWSKLAALSRREKLDAEMSEELRAHLELQTGENIARGMPPGEAYHEAQRKFGNVGIIQERVCEQRGGLWLENFSKDVRHGFRILARAPGFAFATIVSLAIGIGANTAMFSVVNGVLLRPLPYPDAERLVTLWSENRRLGIAQQPSSYGNIADWRKSSRTLDGVASLLPLRPPVKISCISFSPMKTTLIHLAAGCLCAAAVTAADLTKVADRAAWRVHNREAKLVDEAGRKFVRLDARANDGVAWLVGSDFKEGTVEVDIRGKNAVGQSFVGVAFRGVNDTTYDAIYFRPFNFKIEDPARRQRAVQYISHPKFTWEKLRAESPGKYEQPVSPVPDPDGWFHARIVVESGKVSVFVNDAAKPCLVVTPLSERTSGMVGLWVGNGSSGDFANLKLTPKRT